MSLSPRAAGLFLLALALGCKPAPEPARRDGSAPRPSTMSTAAGDVATTGGDSALLARADQGRIQGRADAAIWVVEISDFQCPYCKVWHDESYPAILREYVQSGKVKMAYLNFPLEMHPNAKPAAEAAMCASAQGRFWPMHDAIFASQERWAGLSDATPVFESLAAGIGADVAAWRRCMQSDAVMPLIEADYERATRSGVRSTPSFFVGDQAVAGAQPVQVFRDAIERALAARRGGATTPPGR